MRKKIPSTDVKSVITEIRRSAVKNKHVSCGLHYFWIKPVENGGPVFLI